MITGIRDNISFLIRKLVKVKAGQTFLVIVDNYARPKFIGQIVDELLASFGARTTFVVMEGRTHAGHEPPAFIAAGMKQVDVIFQVFETFNIAHTTARKEATEAGVKFFFTTTQISEDYFKKRISFKDLTRIAERTERLVEILNPARVVRLTTPYGTDLTMSVDGRQALPLHPLPNFVGTYLLPDYAEAAICPQEGTSEGAVVADASVQKWGYLLREPIRFTVKKGCVDRVIGKTEDAAKFRKLIAMDEYASNCAAELGIGTSHTVPKHLQGGMWDYAIMGTVHIAVGRNNDIGGTVLSKIHNDVLMTRPTMEVDGARIIENGTFKI
jgi:leucyl aminopeptidase (aminopeptidase T)